jgi:membrane associated rhomboid family serine protease
MTNAGAPEEHPFGWPVTPPAGTNDSTPWPGSGQPPAGWAPGPGGPPPPGGWPAQVPADQSTGGWFGTAPSSPPGSEAVGLGPNTRCYEHPDRLAGAICRACNRPICADCMVQAAVGWHCRRCVRQNARSTPVVRYRPGMAGLIGPGRSPVTMALIAINLVLFLAASASISLTVNSYEIPYFVQQGQWYRLFSSFFVTNDVADIALNMFSLYIIGRLVEPALGQWRYFAVYMLSGLGGSVATYLLARGAEASAGASGAIFGLVGAYFVLARRARLNTSGIVAIVALNLVFDFTYSGINWLAHLGGLAVGLVVALGYGAGGQNQKNKAAIATIVCVCVALGLLMLLPPGRVALE